MSHDTCARHERLAEVALHRYFEFGWYMLGVTHEEIAVSDAKDTYGIETITRVRQHHEIGMRNDKFGAGVWEHCTSPVEYYALKRKLLHESNHDPIFESLFREFETQLIQRFVDDAPRIQRATRLARVAPKIAQWALENTERIVNAALEAVHHQAGRIAEDRNVASLIMVKVSTKHPDAEISLEFPYRDHEDTVRVEIVPSDETRPPFQFTVLLYDDPKWLVGELRFIWDEYRPVDPNDTLFYLSKLTLVEPHSAKIEWWVQQPVTKNEVPVKE